LRVSVSFIIVLMVGAAGSAAAGGYFSNAKLERDEINGLALDAQGQRTCIREAMAASRDAPCAREPVPNYFYAPPREPYEGTLILDSFYTTYQGVRPAGDHVRGLDETVEDVPAAIDGQRAPATSGQTGGNNLHRDTDGELPDVILPGIGQVRAWHGHWDDKNENGIIESWGGAGSRAAVDNEWSSKPFGKIAAYVDPGSHPDYRNLDRPGDSSPDFWYSRFVGSGYTYYQTGLQATNFILFTDGSLLKSMMIRSVTDPILAPNEDGTVPYTTTDKSLVDIDVYNALAPGPIAGLYVSTVGGPVNQIGSPSVGSCPNGCRPGVFSTRGLGLDPLEPFVAALASDLYAPYPREWAEGEGSTSSGRHADHIAAYTPWIDLIPSWGYRSTSNLDVYYFFRGGPLPGKTADGRQAMLPGFLSFEIRTGIWKDLDGDGFVGSGGSDPYHGGTRPLGDDYTDPRGEFFGIFADSGSYQTASSFRLHLVPDTTWGGGVLDYEKVALTGADKTKPNIVCYEQGGRTTCVYEPTSSGYYLGNETLTLSARRDVVGYSAGDDRTPGLYRSGAMFLPFGSEGIGFTVCTDELTLKYDTPEGEATATLKDCDWIGPLAPPG